MQQRKADLPRKQTTGTAEPTAEKELYYQTTDWGPPARFELEVQHQGDDRALVVARVLDADRTLCADADFFVSFALAGEGRLIDNLGTACGSRYIQLASGRASLGVALGGGRSVVSVVGNGLPPAFLEVD